MIHTCIGVVVVQIIKHFSKVRFIKLEGFFRNNMQDHKRENLV